jgi:esterase/lipase superfamily enzyme
MEIEYHKWWSPSLNQDMELKVYGRSGKPVLVFPCMNGRFFEFEDYGMVNAVSGSIDAGEIQLFTVDSIDSQSWTNQSAHPADRVRRHEDYDRYITTEVFPFINGKNDGKTKILTTGCSMGGYHSLNFFLRHPDQFDSVISLSGVAQLNIFLGDYCDEIVYLNSPLLFLKNLSDDWYLNQYRNSKIVLCSGQGSWEEQTLADMRAIAEILASKNIACWLDLWGYDVNHDWPWWRQQLPYFLKALGYTS